MYLELLKHQSKAFEGRYRAASLVLAVQNVDDQGHHLLGNEVYSLAELDDKIKAIKLELDELRRQASQFLPKT